MCFTAHMMVCSSAFSKKKKLMVYIHFFDYYYLVLFSLVLSVTDRYNNILYFSFPVFLAKGNYISRQFAFQSGRNVDIFQSDTG